MELQHKVDAQRGGVGDVGGNKRLDAMGIVPGGLVTRRRRHGGLRGNGNKRGIEKEKMEPERPGSY